MCLKKSTVKIKVSLHRLYVYYKQLTHILYVIGNIDTSTYIIVNNQLNLNSFLDIMLELSSFGLIYKYFKFNINIYKYLIKNKFFTLIKFKDNFIFFNFNYILQIPSKNLIDYTSLCSKLLALNTGFIHFFYFKLPFYEKIISLPYYREFLERTTIAELTYKNVKLLIFYKLILLRLLYLNIHIKNVPNYLPIS